MKSVDDLAKLVAEHDALYEYDHDPEEDPQPPAPAEARAAIVDKLGLPPDYAAFLARCDGWREFEWGWVLAGTGTLETVAENTETTFEDCDVEEDAAKAALVVGFSENDASMLYYDRRTRKPDGSMDLVAWLYEELARYPSIDAYFALLAAGTREEIERQRAARQATRDEWTDAWRARDDAAFREQLASRLASPTVALSPVVTAERIEALAIGREPAVAARDLRAADAGVLVAISFYLRAAPTPAEVTAIVKAFHRRFPERPQATIERLGAGDRDVTVSSLADPEHDPVLAAALDGPATSGKFGVTVILDEVGAKPQPEFLRDRTSTAPKLHVLAMRDTLDPTSSSYVAIDLAVDTDPGIVRELVMEIADLVPFVSGQAGYRARASGEEAVAAVYHWSRRFLALDVHDLRLELAPLRSAVKGASWLTMIGAPIRDALVARFGPDHVTFDAACGIVTTTGRHGVVIESGALDLGDVRSSGFPFAIAEVDRRIAPLRLSGFSNDELLSIGGRQWIATYTEYDGPFGDGTATADWLTRFVVPEGHLGPTPLTHATRLLRAFDEAHGASFVAKWNAEAKKNPRFGELLRHLVNAAHAHDASDEALGALEYVASLASRVQSRAVNNLFYTLLRRSELDRARPFMALAMELGPKNPGIFHNAACILARQGDRAGALTMVKAAIANDYEKKSALETDADLASIAAEPEFRALFLPPT